MEDFIWQTEHQHPDNTFTMDEYLNEHLPENFNCFFQDGSYAEIINTNNEVMYGLNAAGNGDSFNHKITFEFIR